MRHCKRVTIFEGPDGSGKTTMAREFAQTTNAIYAHHRHQPMMNNTMRLYIESMMPALLGYQDVVLDRSWLSDVPYNKVRGNKGMPWWQKCVLERLAMRCGAVVVHCDPGYDTCQNNFLQNIDGEMLTDVGQLRQVWMLYYAEYTNLPRISYDYRQQEILGASKLSYEVDNKRMATHPVISPTVGNWKAGTLVISSDPTDTQYILPCDSYYRFPFTTAARDPWERLYNTAEEWVPFDHNTLWLDTDKSWSPYLEYGWKPELVCVMNIEDEERAKSIWPDAVIFQGCDIAVAKEMREILPEF